MLPPFLLPGYPEPIRPSLMLIAQAVAQGFRVHGVSVESLDESAKIESSSLWPGYDFYYSFLVLEYISLYCNSYNSLHMSLIWILYVRYIDVTIWVYVCVMRFFWAIPTMPNSMHIHNNIVFVALCGTARNHQQILPCRYSAWWSRDEGVQ